MGVSTYTSHARDMSFMKQKLPMPIMKRIPVHIITRNSFLFFVSLRTTGDQTMQNTAFTVQSLATHLDPISAPKYPAY